MTFHIKPHILIWGCGLFTLAASLAMGADPATDIAPTTQPDLALQPAPVLSPPPAQYGDNVRLFQGIPSIETAPHGRLWAAWYGGGPGEGPFNYVMLATSADQGKTWSNIKLAIDPPGDVRAFDPNVWLDPTGKLWLTWAQGWSH